MATPTPIKLVVGDDWELPFTYKDAAGVPIDLTGFTVGADVIWTGGMISASGSAGEVILSDQSVTANRGKFVVKFDHSASATVPPRKCGTHLRVYLVNSASDRRSFPAWPLEVEAK